MIRIEVKNKCRRTWLYHRFLYAEKKLLGQSPLHYWLLLTTRTFNSLALRRGTIAKELRKTRHEHRRIRRQNTGNIWVTLRLSCRVPEYLFRCGALEARLGANQIPIFWIKILWRFLNTLLWTLWLEWPLIQLYSTILDKWIPILSSRAMGLSQRFLDRLKENKC